MAGKDFVAQVFDKADELRENKVVLLKQIDANRGLMRNLWQSDMLSDEQTAEAFERYPTLAGRGYKYNDETRQVEWVGEGDEPGAEGDAA